MNRELNPLIKKNKETLRALYDQEDYDGVFKIVDRDTLISALLNYIFNDLDSSTDKELLEEGFAHINSNRIEDLYNVYRENC